MKPSSQGCRIGNQYKLDSFIFTYEPIDYCVVNSPFVQTHDDRGIYFITDLDAICSQCKKPFKEHEKWK